jgi:transmembrane sensor
MSSENSAADWFARMHGPDAADARAAFLEWYADPGNAAAYDHLARTWDQAKFLASTPTGRARNLEHARPGGGRAGAIALGTTMLLAIIVCVLLVGPHLWSGRQPGRAPAMTEIAGADKPRTVVLADGSRITLDRASRLGIAFTAGERRLSLRAGRARFDVAHDKARPFVVEAGGGSVVAHGTVFDVALVGDGIEVVLLRGAVEVRDGAGGAGPARARHLSPGQKVALSGGALAAPVAAGPRDTQWPEPMIAFNATPLGEAVAAFNRTGGRAIRIDAAAARGLHVTGAFRRGDPEGFAATLAATFGLAVRREDPAALTLVVPPAAPEKKP